MGMLIKQFFIDFLSVDGNIQGVESNKQYLFFCYNTHLHAFKFNTIKMLCGNVTLFMSKITINYHFL